MNKDLKKALIWIPIMSLSAIPFYFNRELGLIAFTSLIFILSFVTEREHLWAWIPAFIISWLWVFAARNYYSSYNVFSYSVFGISIFPILAWPTMLAGMHFLVFAHIQIKNRWQAWMVYFSIFAACLILSEYIGYNLAGVQLAAGTEYPGWPVLNIFHCPWWMQAAYFLNGFLFSGIAAYFIRREPSWNSFIQQIRRTLSTSTR